MTETRTPQQDPKAPLKFAALVALVSVVIGIPYSLCGHCPQSEPIFPLSSSLLNVIFSGLVGALISILIYKMFNESEKSLTRRLDRIRKAGPSVKPEDPKNIRVWVDGCFDLTHLGHYNIWRQAAKFGHTLVVGINPDKEVLRYKGPPIYTEEERKTIAESCKWVDEVVENVPYVMNEEYIQDVVFNKYKCDYIAHGDDPCLTPEGNDVFASAKRLGRYLELKRTEGVSTSDYLGRMLRLTKAHHNKNTIVDDADDDEEVGEDLDGARYQCIQQDTGVNSNSFLRTTTLFPTTHRFVQFSQPHKTPPKGAKIVYIDGAWDLFHAGHVDLLKAVRQYGDFVIVGVYTDHVANTLHGENYPILNLNERVLSVLSCKYVDDVVIGAPYNVSRDFCVTFNISVVCHGSVCDTRPGLLPFGDISEGVGAVSEQPSTPGTPKSTFDPYAYPRSQGMVVSITSPRDTTIKSIVSRIISQKQAFEAKFEKKNKSEQAYNEQKQFVQEV